MPRNGPLICPVKGCSKRGGRGDLMRHARSKHPDMSSELYSRALNNTALQQSVQARPRAPRRYPATWLVIIIAVAFLACVIYLGSYTLQPRIAP